MNIYTCSHYIVYAVPVARPIESPRSAPFVPTVPYTHLFSKSVSLHLASIVSTIVPFIAGQYKHNTLPDKLFFNKTRALKPKANYVFIVVAFTDTQEVSMKRKEVRIIIINIIG